MKLHPLKNTGLIESGPSETSWLAGAETGIKGIVLQPDGQWDNNLPTEEKQRNADLESNLCVTFSGLNVIETYVDHLISNKLISEKAIKQITDLGFMDENGHFNCNEMFAARTNKSSRNGNSLENFWEGVRKFGLLPQKMWSDVYKDIHSFDELYGPEVPQELLDYAKKILDILDINYQWVLSGRPNDAKLKDYLKQSPLHVATPVCNTWNNEEVAVCYDPSGAKTTICAHATMVYGYSDRGVKDFDQYNPFKKLFLNGYYIPYAIGCSITEKEQIDQTKPSYTFTRTLQLGSVGQDVMALQNILIYENLLNSKLNTGYYGKNTETAVSAFQTKYASEILTPIGLILPTGKVYRMTIKALNARYSKQKGIFAQIINFFTSMTLPVEK